VLKEIERDRILKQTEEELKEKLIDLERYVKPQ
jgi:hypothetical protein